MESQAGSSLLERDHNRRNHSDKETFSSELEIGSSDYFSFIE